MADSILDPDWLTSAQVALRLGVSQRRVQQLVKDGYLPVIPDGRDFLTSRETVSELIARRRSYRWRRVDELIYPGAGRPGPDLVEHSNAPENGFDPDDVLMELYHHIGERIRSLDPRKINQTTRDDILSAGAAFAQALFRASRNK